MLTTCLPACLSATLLPAWLRTPRPAEKHAAEKNRPTDIICKFFLEAVEKRAYGWFWQVSPAAAVAGRKRIA